MSRPVSTGGRRRRFQRPLQAEFRSIHLGPSLRTKHPRSRACRIDDVIQTVTTGAPVVKNARRHHASVGAIRVEPKCSAVPFCGDGIKQSQYESCDRGLLNDDASYDGCTTTCDWGQCRRALRRVCPLPLAATASETGLSNAISGHPSTPVCTVAASRIARARPSAATRSFSQVSSATVVPRAAWTARRPVRCARGSRSERASAEAVTRARSRGRAIVGFVCRAYHSIAFDPNRLS